VLAQFCDFCTETDYPPKANAGSDKVIHLPQDSVILYGNSSTDDKGIKSYEWIKSADDKLAADMTVCTLIRRSGILYPVLLKGGFAFKNKS
jgi:hypothetical protein